MTWHELTDTLEKKHEQLLGSAQPEGGSWGKITTDRRFIGIAFFELLRGNSDILVTTFRHGNHSRYIVGQSEIWNESPGP